MADSSLGSTEDRGVADSSRVDQQIADQEDQQAFEQQNQSPVNHSAGINLSLDSDSDLAKLESSRLEQEDDERQRDLQGQQPNSTDHNAIDSYDPPGGVDPLSQVGSLAAAAKVFAVKIDSAQATTSSLDPSPSELQGSSRTQLIEDESEHQNRSLGGGLLLGGVSDVVSGSVGGRAGGGGNAGDEEPGGGSNSSGSEEFGGASNSVSGGSEEPDAAINSGSEGSEESGGDSNGGNEGSEQSGGGSNGDSEGSGESGGDSTGGSEGSEEPGGGASISSISGSAIDSNDAATVSTAVVGLAETNAALTASGTLTASDVDNSENTFTASSTTGTIGQFSIDAAGAWSFTAHSAYDELNVGESVSETFTVSTVDGTASTVQITINGSNDAPEITTAIADFGFSESADASAQDLSNSGTLSFTDIDTTNVIDVTSAVTSSPVWSGGTIDAALATTLADGFSISGSDVAAPGSVDWSYSVRNADLDFLAAGETISLTYTVAITDNNGATDTDTVTVTIIGTNDVPVISRRADTSGSITAGNDATSSISGTLSATDVDANTTQAWTIEGMPSTTYGSIAIDSAGNWTYTLDNSLAATQALPKKGVQEVFMARVTDDAGDFVDQAITITIKGGSKSIPPIFLDLDGDGRISYLSAQEGVVWDYGFGLSASAWVDRGDGLLVYDYNDDGVIAEAKEFVFTLWGNHPDVLTDMQALAAYFDTNQDALLDHGDAVWGFFGVWRDLNVDGVQDDGEFSYLSEAGISGISLSYDADSSPSVAADGDVLIYGQMSVSYEDGSVGLAEDAAFLVDTPMGLSEDGSSQYGIDNLLGHFLADIGSSGVALTTEQLAYYLDQAVSDYIDINGLSVDDYGSILGDAYAHLAVQLTSLDHGPTSDFGADLDGDGVIDGEAVLMALDEHMAELLAAYANGAYQDASQAMDSDSEMMLSIASEPLPVADLIDLHLASQDPFVMHDDQSDSHLVAHGSDSSLDQLVSDFVEINAISTDALVAMQSNIEDQSDQADPLLDHDSRMISDGTEVLVAIDHVIQDDGTADTSGYEDAGSLDHAAINT